MSSAEDRQTLAQPAGQDVEHQSTGVQSPNVPSIDETQLDQDDDPFLVNFEYNDPKDPRSFPTWRKIQILIVTMLLEFWVNVISSIYSFGALQVAEQFGVSDVASRVPAAVFLFGFAIGPVFAAPLSEDYGRIPVMIIGLVILSLLQIGCALATNLATLIVLRFIGGCFGAVAFNSIGTVADLWDSENQGWGVNTFALSAEGGATVGPIIGAFVVQDAGWRWTFGVSGIVLAFLLALFVLTVPETRAGVILAKRAKKLRREDARYHTSHEKVRSQRTAKELLKETVGRPLFMLFTEPIVFWFTLFDAGKCCSARTNFSSASTKLTLAPYFPSFSELRRHLRILRGVSLDLHAVRLQHGTARSYVHRRTVGLHHRLFLVCSPDQVVQLCWHKEA